MTPDQRPAVRVTDLGGGVAVRFGLWFVSVAVLNVLVGSPLTDLYVGFSIVAVAFWLGWKVATHFDEPPGHGAVELVDAEERRYRGHAGEDGQVRFTGPDGEWGGTTWSGSWAVEDPRGGRWTGRVGKKGTIVLAEEGGEGELRGTVRPTE